MFSFNLLFSFQEKEKQSKSSKEEDSVKLKNLKKYVRACHLYKNYIKLFADCRSMKAKERTLERVLRDDTGIEGEYI
jgi:hypothetical protein